MGYLYVMSNPSFKDNLLKIGKSDYDPGKRKKELETTGVPDAFFVEYCVRFDNHHSLESQVHRKLTSNRTNRSREFFNITVPQAISIVREILKGKKYDEYIFYRDPDEVERETRQQQKKEEIEVFLSFVGYNMNEIVQQKRSSMEQNQDKDVFWAWSLVLCIVLTIPVSFYAEAIWPLIIHGILTWWAYVQNTHKHNDKVNKILQVCPDLIEKEVDNIRKALMNDPDWHTNMPKWKDYAMKTIDNVIQKRYNLLF